MLSLSVEDHAGKEIHLDMLKTAIDMVSGVWWRAV